MVYFGFPSAYFILFMIAVLYVIGTALLIWLTRLTIKQIWKSDLSFRKTFRHSMLGGFLGAIIASIVFNFFAPEEPIHGTENYVEELKAQIKFTGYCIYFPTITVIAAAISSIIYQFRK